MVAEVVAARAGAAIVAVAAAAVVLEPLQILNLGLISLGDRPPWNSIGVPPSKLLLKGCRKDSSIA